MSREGQAHATRLLRVGFHERAEKQPCHEGSQDAQQRVHSTAPCSAAQHSTAQHSTAQLLRFAQVHAQTAHALAYMPVQTPQWPPESAAYFYKLMTGMPKSGSTDLLEARHRQQRQLPERWQHVLLSQNPRNTCNIQQLSRVRTAGCIQAHDLPSAELSAFETACGDTKHTARCMVAAVVAVHSAVL